MDKSRSRSPSRRHPSLPRSRDDAKTLEVRDEVQSKAEPTAGSTLNMDAISVFVTSQDQSKWVERAAQIFKEFRVVILQNLFSQGVTDTVWDSLRDLHQKWGAKYDTERDGNRLPGRYDMGSAYNTAHLAHLPGYLEAFDEFVQKGGVELLEKLGGYKFVGGQGTLCLAHTDNYQPLHSDFKKAWHPSMDEEPGHSPCLDLMFTVHPLTSENGAMRIIPGQPSVDKTYRQERTGQPPKVDEESESSKRSQLHPLPAGCGILRDIRVWHGGVPNTTDEDRHIPVLQFYSNWWLSLCESIDKGRGLDGEKVRSKLSLKAQEAVSSDIIRREGDEEPWIEGKSARWPGEFY